MNEFCGFLSKYLVKNNNNDNNNHQHHQKNNKNDHFVCIYIYYHFNKRAVFGSVISFTFKIFNDVTSHVTNYIV